MIRVQLERNAKIIIWELHTITNIVAKLIGKKKETPKLFFIIHSHAGQLSKKTVIQSVLTGCLTYKCEKMGLPRHTYIHVQ